MPPKTLSAAGLSTLSKEELKRALQGDFSLMGFLALQWHLDALVLKSEGKEADALSFEEIQKMQLLMRDSAEKGRSAYAFYPQTYLSAALLLTLAPSAEITALPEGFRREPLYPETFTCKVVHDASPVELESSLSLNKTVAFVAPYSNPSIKEALKNRGAILVESPYVNSLEKLEQVIVQMGAITGEDVRAEILALFVKAALLHFRNLTQPENSLYLNVCSTLSSPREETLVYQTLERFRLTIPKAACVEALGHPQEILLSAIDRKTAHAEISKNPGLRALLDEGTHFTYLDWREQETLSHFFLLGSFDIAAALQERR